MVFALIFAIIFMGFLFVFGGDMLALFFPIGEHTQIKKMIIDLEKKVDQLHWNTGLGSSDIMTISLPGNTKFCFIDPLDLSASSFIVEWKRWSVDQTSEIIIQDEQNMYNIWYFYRNEQNGYKINHLIRGGSKNFCTRNGVKIYLENKRDGVSVELY